MILLIYFITINIIGSVLFIEDKISASKQRRRVRESHLHAIELLGGVFSMFLLIFIIRHKSKKKSYYFISAFILIIWLLLMYYGCKFNFHKMCM